MSLDQLLNVRDHSHFINRLSFPSCFQQAIILWSRTYRTFREIPFNTLVVGHFKSEDLYVVLNTQFTRKTDIIYLLLSHRIDNSHIQPVLLTADWSRVLKRHEPSRSCVRHVFIVDGSWEPPVSTIRIVRLDSKCEAKVGVSSYELLLIRGIPIRRISNIEIISRREKAFSFQSSLCAKRTMAFFLPRELLLILVRVIACAGNMTALTLSVWTTPAAATPAAALQTAVPARRRQAPARENRAAAGGTRRIMTTAPVTWLCVEAKAASAPAEVAWMPSAWSSSQ